MVVSFVAECFWPGVRGGLDRNGPTGPGKRRLSK
jgi:hypothetical protein